MLINRVKMSFSYLGNYVDFLISNEQRIKNMMLDYEIQSKVDKLNDGREVKSLLFTKQNVSVRLLSNRIDYEYGFMNNTVLFEDVFSQVKEFYSLFGEIFPEVGGNRIAIVLNSFINNQGLSAITAMADKFNFTSNFGECNELTFKINTPKQAKESLNSVLNVSMGVATNNKTKENMNVLLLAFDVNTMASKTENRFYPAHFKTDFNELLKEIEHRCQQFNDL